MAKNKQLLIIFSLSLLIHIALIVLWLFLKPLPEKPSQPTKITIQLKQNPSTEKPIPDPEPEKQLKVPEEKPEPVPVAEVPIEDIILPNEYFRGDEMQSSNQEDQTAREVKLGTESVTEKQKQAKQDSAGVLTTNSEVAKQLKSGEQRNNEAEINFTGQYQTLIGYDDETNESQGEAEQALESHLEQNESEQKIDISDELGNYQLLDDQELDAAFVKDPYSEKKHKELKIINIYFKQISDVIFANWVNPLSPAEAKSGVYVKIVFELNDLGFLVEPRLALQSRYAKLDSSLLEAVKKSGLHRFDFPESYLNKYRYLSLSWSSDGTEYELMPFEKDMQKETP